MSFQMVHNIQRWHDKPREVLEDTICVEFQREIRRAITKVREAHEILSSLMVSLDNSIEDLLTDRANALGSNLTRTELEVISIFIEGRSPETIAEERSLSERTISNQLRTGCHKLGFSDRQELKGWAGAVSVFFLTQPPKD